MRSLTLAGPACLLALFACAPDDPVPALAEAVRAAVTQQGLEEHTRAIVQHERPSGSAGENAAIDHIVATLEADGIPVEVHTIQAYASDPVSASVEVIGGGFAPKAITASFSATARGLEARLVDAGGMSDLPREPGTGERMVVAGQGMASASARAKPLDVAGAIVLVDGQPRGGPVVLLQQLGAAGVIFVNAGERLTDLIATTTWGIPSLLNYDRLPAIPVVHVTRSAGEELRARLSRGPVRLRMSAEASTGWKPLRLAVARIPAPDPDAPYVLFAGHIDAWYHGGTDEGASNAAMLELARAFFRNRQLLRRGLVVAWWPGHSNARYSGSTWFSDHYFDELRTRGLAYVNIDGIGQMGAKQFGASATASLAGLAKDVVLSAISQEIEPGRPGGNSDQSFNGIGLPLFQINHSRLEEDGGYWWWHTVDDDIDKVDYGILETDTELYADAFAEMLAAPIFPVDLVAEVDGLGKALADIAATAGDRFDLSEATARHAQLTEAVTAIQGSLPARGSAELDLALVGILRPLHRVLYVPLTPYHMDSGSERGPLAGLAAVRTLAEEEPGTDRYRFAETLLIRERNRLLEALDDAIAAAERLRAGL